MRKSNRASRPLKRDASDARGTSTRRLRYSVAMPILLSQGIPLLPAGARSPSLRLSDSKTLPSGTVLLTYAVHHP